MADGPYKITRAELARFLPSQRAIRAFEQLFDIVPGDINQINAEVSALAATIGAIELESGQASASANAAFAATSTLQTEIDAVSRTSDAAQIASEGAISTANAAVSAVNRLAEAIELLALAPAVTPTASDFDIAPPVVHAVSQQDISTPVINEVRRKRYGVFHSNVTQTAAAINTAYGMTLNITDVSFGVYTGTPNSRVYVDTEGLYNFQFSAQLEKTAGGLGAVFIWVRVNGVDIPDTATKIRIQGNNSECVAAWNFVLFVNAGDYFELMWSTDDTSCQIFASAASSPVPSIPSVILTVTDNIS